MKGGWVSSASRILCATQVAGVSSWPLNLLIENIGSRVRRPRRSHPFADTGEFSGEGPDARFTMTRPYFGPSRFEGSAERDGLSMTFRGWTHSLEDYAIALESAGLLVELLREPRPARSSAGDESELPLPMFLYLRAMKPVP
jgi:hypothetical protein